MQKITYANPVLIFCQNKNNKKTDMRKIVSSFENFSFFCIEKLVFLLIRSAKVGIIY